ncbi:solute carrier family 41 member 1-like protein [Absidia repens]|uniref:Solute carrier family 41 member 1-like protein n=1 Tax=Absidia repens TaxID=90262 RepID=A0A1X2IKL0_9FUNG|nr:solute carrier family 41 member 1-like protein [Absidia repens]
MASSYSIASSTEQIELRPRQVEDGLIIPRHHKRSASSSSFVHFKAPPLQTDPIIEETSLPNELHHLASQALPSLLISVIGLVFAGWMMDIFQHWDVFSQISELFILVPVLLNLKGNLEMNLAARFSTSANLGDLDHPQKRNALIWGNLALIQVQALIAGAIAGIFSFVLGILEHPTVPTSVSESILVITSSMVAATVSSFVLGVFMCILIIISRKMKIDPDNIACPMASSLGDVVTLGILAASAHGLMIYMDSFLGLTLMICMVFSIPFFARSVWQNSHVKDLLYTGWSPIMIAMLISSFAGLVLERYVEKYKGLAMLTPIVCGLTGNLGSIYASRISTSLHAGTEQDQQVERILLLMNIPVQFLFLYVIWLFDLGHLDFTIWFALTYFVVAMLCTLVALKMGKSMTLLFWKRGYDPDNFVLPYLTALIDVICTTLLVISFSFLTTYELADMATTSEEI